MPTAKQPSDAPVYQLKVTLKYSQPPIWRRLQVRSDITLAKLHQILQVAMGWYDSHLHQFDVRGTHYGVPASELGLSFGPEVKNERNVRLNQIVTGEKFKFGYMYDFGDSWDHDIIVEKVLQPEEGVRYPVCIKGKRACPPEDVGGIWSYASFLEVIQDPNHPEHGDLVEWVDGDFDPEAFNLDEVNAELKRIK